MQWWQAYLVTLVVELPIVLGALRAARLAGPGGVLSWPAAVAWAWAVNLTHPILWLIRPDGGWLLVAEVVIGLVEGAVLWFGFRRGGRGVGWICLFAALLANAVSFAVGVLWALLG